MRLAGCLRAPDPQVRDGAPYVVLRTWIARDVITGSPRLRLGDEMTRRFTDGEIQARTFAPMVLDMIVTRGDFRQPWLDAFGTWFPAKTDLRGHDPKLGRLHAVALGADLLGTSALTRTSTPRRCSPSRPSASSPVTTASGTSRRTTDSRARSPGS
ncbi:DUF2785 domain-containing protein [Streptomyces sp. NPDC048577]|uniref:DUF2785 domain-containing protein n=1 Tax=Streptomyces sp. NPDC048577 TaxID=3157209 RepID=UPI00342F8BC8